MKRLLYLFLLISPACIQANEWNMIAIRELYTKAATSKADAEKFHTFIEAIKVPNASIKGYHAASYMLQANHHFNPGTKLSYFNKGKEKLDQAIQSEPQNTELRFVRFCIQTNAPFFLGYNKHIEQDKAIIIQAYPLLSDIDLKKRIKDFMLQTTYCTNSEKYIFN